MRRAALLIPLALGSATLVAIACGGDGGVPTDSGVDGASPTDAGADMSSDSASSPDGPSDASDAATACEATGYHDMTNPACWSAFDLKTVNPGAKGFAGAVFDGRYVYFATNFYGNGSGAFVGRYDTLAPFTTGTSWATFDTTTVDARAKQFAGAVFDGRYVYLVPFENGLVVRYDTQSAFTAGAAWATFDLTMVTSNFLQSVGFTGAVFDGRYVYLVPGNGVVPRYDTQAAFTTTTSWAVFDLTPLTGSEQFKGGVFDSRYVYLVPSANNASSSGVVARYDTTAAFALYGSWAKFDLTTAEQGAKGFFGGAFDGRYVYLAPDNNGTTKGPVAAYDTQATFALGASWPMFDIQTSYPLFNGFRGAAFDGRYVYFVPCDGAYADGVARYDTQATFTAASSWATFNTYKLSGLADSYEGAAFDGRYLYFVPTATGVVARFDAKTPPGLPPGPAHGSFF